MEVCAFNWIACKTLKTDTFWNWRQFLENQGFNALKHLQVSFSAKSEVAFRGNLLVVLNSILVERHWKISKKKFLIFFNLRGEDDSHKDASDIKDAKIDFN